MPDENRIPSPLEHQGAEALNLMEKALALLDDCGSTGEVCAHLDLAMCRLKEKLGLTGTKF